jgi:hypothetical protein
MRAGTERNLPFFLIHAEWLNETNLGTNRNMRQAIKPADYHHDSMNAIGRP